MEIFLKNEHHQVIDIWLEKGIQNFTLITFDAHLDINWIPNNSIEFLRSKKGEGNLAQYGHTNLLIKNRLYFDIGNFLYVAHTLGLISEIIWVVPDLDYKNLNLNMHLQKMLYLSECEYDSFVLQGDSIQGILYGIPIRICAAGKLGNLTLPEKILLDIDLDYFVGYDGLKTWIEPEYFYHNIKNLFKKADFITICYSISSGYLPEYYAYLGEYLVTLIEEREDSGIKDKHIEINKKLDELEAKSLVQHDQKLLEDKLGLGCFFLAKDIFLELDELKLLFSDNFTEFEYTYLQSLLYQKNKFFDIALSYMTRALDNTQYKRYVQKSLMLLLYQMKEKSWSSWCTEDLLALEHDAEVYLLKGIMRKEQQQYEDSIWYLKKSIEVKLVNPKAYLELAKIYEKLEDAQGKNEYIKRFIKYNTISII